ncbi:MAG: TRAP transporter large permease [Desulfotomaculales bacterium]
MLAEIILPVVIILVGLALFLNAPIYIAILAAAFYLQIFVNGMPLQNIFTGLFEALTKNSLLAVPFFIVAGNFIAASSLGTRLINLFIACLKNVRAGLSISCLLANAVFGAISGSPPAATATFGKIIYDPLEKAHGQKLALGLITSAGALSSIIPPSIIMIIYGIATDTSVAQLFMGGFLPGLVVVLIIGIYLFFRCKTSAFTGEPTSAAEIKKAFWRGIPVLVLPVLILGGIYGGIFTPTEAGAVAAAYSAVVGVLFLKDITLSQVLDLLKDSARTTGQIFILIASSVVFAQAATISQLPHHLTTFFSSFDDVQFLLFLNILLLLVGCFFEPSAAILILAPLLLPAAKHLGIDPLHLGIVFTVNLAIGMFTPPFGLNIFVSQSILKKSMGEISSGVLPFIVLYILALCVITYVPSLSLVLPRLLYGIS